MGHLVYCTVYTMRRTAINCTCEGDGINSPAEHTHSFPMNTAGHDTVGTGTALTQHKYIHWCAFQLVRKFTISKKKTFNSCDLHPKENEKPTSSTFASAKKLYVATQPQFPANNQYSIWRTSWRYWSMRIEQKKNEQSLVTKTHLDHRFHPLVWTVENDVKTLVWTQSFLSVFGQTKSEVFINGLVWMGCEFPNEFCRRYYGNPTPSLLFTEWRHRYLVTYVVVVRLLRFKTPYSALCFF